MLQTAGTAIDDFYIPPFKVEKGDIVVIRLPNGSHFYSLLARLVDMLTGRVKNDTIDLKAEFRFVEPIKESLWASIFHPLSVEQYVKKYGNPGSDLAKRIYELEGIKPNTKINTLPGNTRKLLSVLTTFSWTNKIILDLAGVDPTGGQQTFNLVKSKINNSGAAILIDSNDDFKNDCSTFLKLEFSSKRN